MQYDFTNNLLAPMVPWPKDAYKEEAPDGASDLDRHIHEGYTTFSDHHDRMMKATEHLREKASWSKRTTPSSEDLK
jgi:hypothetical protein